MKIDILLLFLVIFAAIASAAPIDSDSDLDERKYFI